MADRVFSDIAQSEFNSGLAILYRIDSIRKTLALAKFDNNFKLYFDSLVALFMELVRFIKKDSQEMKDHLTWWDEVKKDYFQILEEKKHGKVPVKLLESFYFWEIQLTILEQKSGVGMNKKEGRGYS